MTFRVTGVRKADACHRRPRITPLRAAVVVSLAVMPLGMPTAHARAPHPAEPKRSLALHIGIDNGHESVQRGDRLTYTIKISNTGATKTPALLLTQTLTPGLKLVSSTPQGKVSADRIAWSRALPAGKTDQFSVTLQVERLPAQLQRLAAVACASAKAGKRPIVCATDSDRLATSPSEGLQGQPVPAYGHGLWYAIAGVGALSTTSLALYARRRRRRRAADAG
ncbi:DUF11 domain-containing protein [Nonomuraea sp. NEAU-A123]|uniref:DUF11 domain-containing protein n=1 Tax=Nonomuraea sp. NEAU-A123 TaxID=2839649 RepID=UPI001BE3E496|nr:DUF11 domain-containing protein [Nonomuraea sp. NEAU-A123]MBT2226561.1 DUF11 domain-containing protein [Nonomuraea sp. NEAU-A123]